METLTMFMMEFVLTLALFATVMYAVCTLYQADRTTAALESIAEHLYALRVNLYTPDLDDEDLDQADADEDELPVAELVDEDLDAEPVAEATFTGYKIVEPAKKKRRWSFFE